MGSPMALENLSLSDISNKGAHLGPKLLSNMNRKPYMESPMAPSNLSLRDLQRSKSWLIHVWSGWKSICYTYSCQ